MRRGRASGQWSGTGDERDKAVRGQVLGVDAESRRGQIAGDDGQRYSFQPEDWDDVTEPSVGARVDFEVEGRNALNIFREPTPQHTGAVAVSGRMAVVPVTDRNKYIAALLAFVFGPLGIHRFYLGRQGSGIAMLVLSCTIIGLIVTYPWSFVDMIRYLAMGDEEFDERYARSHQAVALGDDGRPLALPRR